MICEAEQLKARRKDNTVNLQNMSVSGSGNNTFLKIYWAGNHQKGAISGPGNLQKAREILYLCIGHWWETAIDGGGAHCQEGLSIKHSA